MFIVGDLARIRALLDPFLWEGVQEEHWRERHAPLAAYPPPERVRAEWDDEIVSYSASETARLHRPGVSVWLITLTALRRGGRPVPAS